MWNPEKLNIGWYILTGLKKYEKANGWDWTGLSIALSKGPLISRMPPYLGALPYAKTIISLILRDATWPINQPPLVKTCSKELGKDEKWEPLLPKNKSRHTSQQCNIPQICMQEKEMAACTFGPGLHQISARDMIYMHVSYTHACLLVQKKKKERTQPHSSTCKWHKASSCFQLDRSMWSLRDAWHA